MLFPLILILGSAAAVGLPSIARVRVIREERAAKVAAAREEERRRQAEIDRQRREAEAARAEEERLERERLEAEERARILRDPALAAANVVLGSMDVLGDLHRREQAADRAARLAESEATA